MPELVEYISGITTLRPGDVISTGTTGGVGIFRDPPEPLEPGDAVDVATEGLGTLWNPVVAEVSETRFRSGRPTSETLSLEPLYVATSLAGICCATMSRTESILIISIIDRYCHD